MSYILEALRRAERERQLGQPPTVQTLAHGSTWPQPARHRWLVRGLLAAGTLLLIVIALWGWLRPGVAPVAVPAAPAPLAATVATTAPAPVATTPAASVTEMAEAAAVIDTAADLASLDDVTAPFGTDTGERTVLVTPQGRQPAAVAPAPTPAAAATTAVTPADENQAAPAPRSNVETLTLAPAQPRLLRDMPASYRAGFPAISMDVHVYNEEPARRWVMVGGRRYGEGDVLPAGPRIAEIVSDGVILEHGGERVRVPITR